MTRRDWKRWAWAVVTGAAVAGGGTAADKPAAPDKADKPVAEWKVGDSVPWRIDGQPDKKVTVLKVDRKKGGAVEVELKDPKTGDTFTLTEGPADPAAKPITPPAPAKPADVPADKPAAKDAGLPKAKPRADGPPEVAEAAPTGTPAEPTRRTGPLRRLFGRKPAAVSAEPAPAAVTPPAKPVAEPPAAMPTKTAAPAAPVKPPPSTAPAPLPPVPSPLPAVPPAGAGVPAPLPSIPLPPGGVSRAPAPPGVVPAGYMTVAAARAEEIRPYATLLKEAVAPSARLVAAKALAGCRHASTDEVKGLLFAAAQADPCPSVRADCIGYLADLGYFTPGFAELVKGACDDPSDEVKAAAQAAKAKMSRK